MGFKLLLIWLLNGSGPRRDGRGVRTVSLSTIWHRRPGVERSRCARLQEDGHSHWCVCVRVHAQQELSTTWRMSMPQFPLLTKYAQWWCSASFPMGNISNMRMNLYSGHICGHGFVFFLKQDFTWLLGSTN